MAFSIDSGIGASLGYVKETTGVVFKRSVY